LKRRGGISTRNLIGAAAFRCAIETAPRHFDAQLKRRGGMLMGFHNYIKFSSNAIAFLGLY
jgi:hypothetical protein